MRDEGLSPGAGRDDSFNAALLEIGSQPVGVVGLSAISRSTDPAADSSSSAIMTSWMLPGATSRTRGLPAASVRAWIAVVRPPRERPTPSLKAPFSAGRRAMRPDVRTVD